MKTNNQQNGIGPVKEAIAKTNQDFANAMAKGDALGVSNCYTIDGEFMAPGAPAVVGRKNIQNAMAGYIAQGFTQYKVLSIIVYGNSNVVGVQAAYSLSKPNGIDKDLGKSIQLWKQDDKAWKIFRDCFNSNLPES
tara:strand:+ start:3889 stop:4296 length:408 start_codon:yes stop_codon:yes gene_type:complete